MILDEYIDLRAVPQSTLQQELTATSSDATASVHCNRRESEAKREQVQVFSRTADSVSDPKY